MINWQLSGFKFPNILLPWIFSAINFSKLVRVSPALFVLIVKGFLLNVITERRATRVFNVLYTYNIFIVFEYCFLITEFTKLFTMNHYLEKFDFCDRSKDFMSIVDDTVEVTDFPMWDRRDVFRTLWKIYDGAFSRK